jgi:hypothetical protein
MNVARRVILSLALATALGVISTTLSSLLVDRTAGGWFVHESNANALASSGV